MKPKTILLVDDDEGIRLSLVDVLDIEGYGVVEAENGYEALMKLKALGPDKAPSLILLDLMMPIMDGKSFLKEVQIQADDWMRAIPIVITSAVASFPDDKDLPGVFKRVKKPFNLNDLLRTIDSIIVKI